MLGGRYGREIVTDTKEELQLVPRGPVLQGSKVKFEGSKSVSSSNAEVYACLHCTA